MKKAHEYLEYNQKIEVGAKVRCISAGKIYHFGWWDKEEFRSPSGYQGYAIVYSEGHMGEERYRHNIMPEDLELLVEYNVD